MEGFIEYLLSIERASYLEQGDCIIYGLVDPENNQLRYVGQSFNLVERIKAHLYEDKIPEKLEWMQSLRVKRLFPTVKVIEIVKHNTFNTHVREFYHIEKNTGSGFLFNSTRNYKKNTCNHSNYKLENAGNYNFLICKNYNFTQKIIIVTCDHVFHDVLDGSNKVSCIKCGEYN